MTSNHRVLVDQFIAVAQGERDNSLPEDVAFEVFAAQAALKEYNLSDEEVEEGRIGGGQDGAIDSVHVFLDGMLLTDDSEPFLEGFRPVTIRRNVEIDLHLVQAKRTESFAETALDLAVSSLSRLLDLNQSDEDLARYYSKELIQQFRLFTRAWELLGIRAPLIRIHFDYITRGDTSNVAPAVTGKCRDLEEMLAEKVPGSTAMVRLIGARELWAIASTSPSYDLQIRFGDYNTKGDSYAGLVTLADYYEFLSDQTGALRAYLFDWNVRDFQGDVAVNRDILATLNEEGTEDFWWLNNGVTILCSTVAIGGDKTFTLSDVQIVNGMQTSHSIHSAISKRGGPNSLDHKRSLLVRIIRTQDEQTRDRVIRATNSQTRVPDASLHATEDIHRQIEAHFAAHGWYYDRRKNYYKNLGKPSDRIISISALGQAVMAIGLGRPADARARPSTLLNKPDDYAAVFNANLPLGIYLWLAQAQRRVDFLLLNEAEAFWRTNLRFHISLYLVTKTFGDRIYNPAQLRQIASAPLEIDSTDVFNAFTEIQELAIHVAEEEEWPIDRVAKSRPFADEVIRAAVKAAETP